MGEKRVTTKHSNLTQKIVFEQMGLGDFQIEILRKQTRRLGKKQNSRKDTVAQTSKVSC